ncbi:MAG: EamA family transporter [archaeon]
MIYHILLGFNLALIVLGQLFLKKGMGRYSNFGFKDLPKLITNYTVILGLVFYGFALTLWLVVLTGLDLSYALPIESSNYLLIALSSKFLFKEKVSKKRWLSIFTIILGVILVALS